MNPKYGVLLVTGGHTHQENYGAAFLADPRCRIVGLADEKTVDRRRRDLNDRLAKQFKVPHLEDLDAALAMQGVDIVCICAEPERRGRIALKCAQAGKHLYLDKSLVPALAEADALLAEVQRQKLRSHMFSFITQPWARQAKRVLDSKKLGKLLAIHAECFFSKGRTGTANLDRPRTEEFPPRRHQVIEAKREMDNCGVYPITLIRWLTGLRFRTLHCVTGNYFFQEHQKHNVEDFGLIQGTLDEGLPYTISTGRYGWQTHPGFGSNRLMLVGSEQTAVIDAHRPRLEMYTDETPWTPPNTHAQDPMGFWSSTMQEVHMRPKTVWPPAGSAPVSDQAYFLDRLDAGQDSEINVAEAVLSTEALVAAYQSAAQKRVVTLPLPRG